MQVQLAKVLEHKEIAYHIYKLTLFGEIAESMIEPGQFVNIRVGKGNEFLLRRPISICEVIPEQKVFVVIYRAEGKGTQVLTQVEVGQEVDVLGPLGQGYHLDTLNPGQTALLVGGGIGVPPLYELSKRLNDRGIHTIHVLGFNSDKEIFYEKEFSSLGKTYISTVDGSRGDRGVVTDILEKYQIEFEQYFACGPFPMLKALQEMNKDKTGYVSLEERMACGIGACYACVCRTETNDTARICYEGPVFKAEDIIF
ncbi:dihydroorotate dehydrogenase electron transfer subunit [Streptococcus sp. NLN76]|uniref:dihydroorotate dehydrogenase electron transfer subunit n=1 Tax=Streptococcus sp. NLN76 TaxID=2822800 RepID=UPI0018AC09BA|nr:dihydroorotate dehydrogenase electron transfer subunit [Streptococcus sp. NLN76]MBF8970419.1 dihydroorotate dehydrogenase electron transfer subunit [Streptococcus sp. NLN76]